MAIHKRIYRQSLVVNRAVTAGLLARQNLRLPRIARSTESAKFSTTIDSTIPPLAWLCEREGPAFRFTLGKNVERVGEDAIFEGVWADPLWRLHEGSLTFGSGAIFKPDRVLFLLPKHAYEFLFVLRNHDTGIDVVSPSLCFCLSRTGNNIDLIHAIAAQVFESTNRATAAGSYRYDPFVLRSGPYSLWRFFYGNFSLSPNGSIRIEQPYLGRNFRSFNEYRKHLADAISSIIINGKAPERKHVLNPTIGISCGYDSPAVAALVQEAGATEALTLSVNVNGMNDSGAEIAKDLGLQVQEFEHAVADKIENLDQVELRQDQIQEAAEFIATAGMGDDFAFARFEPALNGKIYFNGALGDSVWPKGADPPPHVPCRVPYGKSLTEFRLRVGFAHVPVPVIGAVFPSSIAAISDSAEMQPYSVGGDYDRPIARRIVEEAGVVRHKFGMRKNATNPRLSISPELRAQTLLKIARRYNRSSRA